MVVTTDPASGSATTTRDSAGRASEIGARHKTLNTARRETDGVEEVDVELGDGDDEAEDDCEVEHDTNRDGDATGGYRLHRQRPHGGASAVVSGTGGTKAELCRCMVVVRVRWRDGPWIATM